MTLREAVIQAHLELGMSREAAELRAKVCAAFIPDGAAHTESAVEPGCEREFIEELKQTFRKVGSDPEAVKAYVWSEIAKRAKTN
jgi:hypothetical protein